MAVTEDNLSRLEETAERPLWLLFERKDKDKTIRDNGYTVWGEMAIGQMISGKFRARIKFESNVNFNYKGLLWPYKGKPLVKPIGYYGWF